jgi:hypothetical protein
LTSPRSDAAARFVHAAAGHITGMSGPGFAATLTYRPEDNVAVLDLAPRGAGEVASVVPVTFGAGKEMEVRADAAGRLLTVTFFEADLRLPPALLVPHDGPDALRVVRDRNRGVVGVEFEPGAACSNGEDALVTTAVTIGGRDLVDVVMTAGSGMVVGLAIHEARTTTPRLWAA